MQWLWRWQPKLSAGSIDPTGARCASARQSLSSFSASGGVTAACAGAANTRSDAASRNRRTTPDPYMAQGERARQRDIFLFGYISSVTACAALAEPSRRLILDLLRERERPVNELVERLRISQPGVSKHLRVLREAGLVAVRADGRRRLYGLEAAPLAEVDAWLAPYRKHWSERLDALERHLEENP